MNSKITSLDSKLPSWLWQMLSLAIAILVFVYILENRSPNFLRPVSMALRTGFGLTVPLAALVVYAVFRVPGRIGDLLSLTVTMSLFALGLAGLWASGNTQSVVLNGIIPLTDASGYYVDAIRLQYGMNVSNFTAMRPLFAGTLSFFLSLSENNLMTAVGIFTAIAGFSCYLACREIQRSHGAESATFVLILMFLYYRHHSGTTMSESLGVTVSLLGVAILWHGITLQKEWTSLFGIAMIALALNVRPGAMFILPALLLWGGWFFRGQRSFSIKFFGLGAIFILLAFFANSRLVDFVSSSGGVPFENFAWAFYGLASGGKSWTYVFEANPELSLLKDTEVTSTIYRLAFEKILSQPHLLVQGAFFYWRMFFSNTWYNAYAFVAGDNYWINEIARWGIYILGLAGIIKWLRNRNDPYTSLAVVSALGILASVPFVPPTDAFRVRLYAATIPFFAILPAMGLFFLLEKLRFPFLQAKQNIPLPHQYPLIVSAFILIGVLFSAPIAIKLNGQPPVLPQQTCLPNMDSFFTRFDPGTFINIQRENKVFLDWMPDFHIGQFRRNAHSLPDTNLTNILDTVPPLSTLFYAVDLKTGQEAIFVAKTEGLRPGTLIQACGTLNYNPEVTPYPVFFAETVEIHSEQ